MGGLHRAYLRGFQSVFKGSLRNGFLLLQKSKLLENRTKFSGKTDVAPPHSDIQPSNFFLAMCLVV